MAIIIPAGVREEWVRHELLDGSCLSLSVPANVRSKMWIELPTSGELCIEVTVGENAACELLTIQEGAVGTVRAQSRIGSGGAIHWRPVTIGGTVEHEIRSVCMGDNARSAASWVIAARAGDHPKAVMRNVFDAHNGTGEVAMRAVATARGQVRMDGRIEIGLGGGGTQTYLTQEALMLDSSAKIDAIPGLEIKTNDVKASHSATVSRVSPEDLFYAGTRGIDPDRARRMFVEGFLKLLLKGIDDIAIAGGILERIGSVAQ